MKSLIIVKLVNSFVLLSFPTMLLGTERRGLVIGLGEYKDKAWSKIHGDKDVPVVKEMLIKCGYTDVVTLTNKKATKSGIASAFRQLAERCKKGDVVYIHFSGHGQQITDVNGDEEDGLDEAWIPYDAMYAYSSTYKGEKHLVDDEIALWINKIKNKIGPSGNLLLVVDACHSGDSSRDTDDNEELFIRGAEKDFIIPLKKKPAATEKTKENWLTLTACRDYQVNCEVKTVSGNYYGMLSYALYNNYADFKKKNNKTITSLIQKFVDKNRHKLPQDITLTGKTSIQPLSVFFKD